MPAEASRLFERLGPLAPPVSVWTEPFLDGVRRGILRVPECAACDTRFWTPQFACPSCLSTDVRWLDTDGRGVVYSHTTVHRSANPAVWPDVPYVLAVVHLDAGPHVLTRLIDCAADEVRVGDPVQAVPFEVNGSAVYPFRLVTGAAR